MSEEIDFDGNNFQDMDKRESIRLTQVVSARIKNQTCTVLNISKRGVLLETGTPVFLFPVSQTILFLILFLNTTLFLDFPKFQ